MFEKLKKKKITNLIKFMTSIYYMRNFTVHSKAFLMRISNNHHYCCLDQNQRFLVLLGFKSLLQRITICKYIYISESICIFMDDIIYMCIILQ